MTPAALDQALAAFAQSGEFRRTTGQLPLMLPHSQSVRRLARSEAPARRGWKLFAWPAAALLAALPVLAIVQPWNAFHTAAPAASHAHDAHARTVNVSSPELASASSVVLPATVRPWQTATLHARVSGYLATWHADLGKQVKAGELLAVIDTPELDQELAQAEAQAQEADAGVTQAKAEREEADSDLKVAQAQLARAKAEEVLAKSQLSRREKLRASKAIPQEEYDTMLRQLEARTAEVAAAEADVARSRTNLDTRSSVIQAREAMANSRVSNVERLRELQGFKEIVAPFDGVVTRRQAEVGMLVTAGSEPLFVVEDVSRVRVQTNVPQAYAAQTREGAAAKVSVPESSNAAESATISRTSESVDATSRTLLAEIELENADRRYQPGSYARVTLAMSRNEASWTIPANTVLMRVEGPHVAVIDNRERVELKRIRLGRDFGSRIAVLEGISGQERLVVNPTDDLVAGSSVEVAATKTPGVDLAKR